MVAAVATHAGGLLGGLADDIVDTFFRVLGNWIAGAAAWFLELVGDLLARSTSPPVGTKWFVEEQGALLAVAAPIAVLALLGAALTCLVRGDLSSLWRTVLLRLPVLALLAAGASGLVSLALAATDDMCTDLTTGGPISLGATIHALAFAVVAQGLAATGTAFVVALFVIAGAVALWFELVVRAAAITVLTASLPLVFAAGLWPPGAAWVRKVAETLGALVVSKVFIVLVLVVATNALVHQDEGASSVLTGTAMLLLATFAPYAVLRLVPIADAAAASHLESMRHRAAVPALRAASSGTSLIVGGLEPSVDAGVDPVGTNPVGMLEVQGADPFSGSVLDDDATFDRPRHPPIIPVPAKPEHHRIEVDDQGLPRLVYRPPWREPPGGRDA